MVISLSAILRQLEVECDMKIAVSSTGNKVTDALNTTVVSSLHPSLKEMLNI